MASLLGEWFDIELTATQWREGVKRVCGQRKDL
jgi:hypothetical protein